MPDSSAIHSLVDARDLLLVTGKGGTGKSTLVATLASLAAKRRGGAVAIELSAHPRLPAMTAPGAKVKTLNLDVEEAVAPALGRLVGLGPVAGAMLNNRLLRLFIRTSPGIKEMVVLDELASLVEKFAKERLPVIVDLPATGHALSMLATPKSVHGMLRVGPLAQVAERVQALLTNAARTELVAVALPEELPVNETIELVKKARTLGVACRTVVVNQVPQPPVDPADRELLDVMQHEQEGVLRRLAGAARDEYQSWEVARGQVERLRAAVEATVVELPRHPTSEPRACVAALVEALTA